MSDAAATTAAKVDPESAVTDLGKSLGQAQQQQPTAVVRSARRPNYLSAQRGARVLFATDEWFAAADNILQDDDAVFDPDAFCIEGKVMDGWETRRRRKVGHDFCIVQLAAPMVTMDEILIDTGYFTGNFVPAVSIQAHAFAVMENDDDDEAVAFVQKVPGALSRLVHAAAAVSYQGTAATAVEIAMADAATATWETIVPVTPLRAGYEETRYHTVYPDISSSTDSNSRSATTHLRINIFPDGGIARIRVYGRPVEPVSLPRCLHPPDLPYAVPHGSSSTVLPSQTMRLQPSGDSSCLMELSLGGQGIDCSNQHYGSPVKLLQASYGKDMGDGWETARHLNRPARLVALAGGVAKDADQDLVDFGDLRDWCIFSLGTPAKTIHSIIVDTKHFRGNYPESVIIEGRNNGDGDPAADNAWDTLVPRSRLAPDAEHLFHLAAAADPDWRPTREIRVTIFPDGGVSRVRVYGEPLLVE